MRALIADCSGPGRGEMRMLGTAAGGWRPGWDWPRRWSGCHRDMAGKSPSPSNDYFCFAISEFLILS
jgi:hypothetical protein